MQIKYIDTKTTGRKCKSFEHYHIDKSFDELVLKSKNKIKILFSVKSDGLDLRMAKFSG
jgi:hypothetical protein